MRRFLFDCRQDVPLAALVVQFARSDLVERHDPVIASFIRLHFDSHQCRVSILTRYTAQEFEVPPMLWSLDDKLKLGSITTASMKRIQSA